MFLLKIFTLNATFQKKKQKKLFFLHTERKGNRKNGEHGRFLAPDRIL